MEEKLNRRPHRMELENRGAGRITGIQDVVSFDENQVVLDDKGKESPREPSDAGEGRGRYRGKCGQPYILLQRQLPQVGGVAFKPSV